MSTLLGVTTPSARFGTASSREAGSLWRAAVYLSVFAFAIGWTLALGKDVHWDAVNYHLYLGFSGLHDRFALDFFGAGTPSYLNPYAYVPLYLMVQAEVPAAAMAAVFAALHALILCMTYELALEAGVRDSTHRSRAFAVLALLLAVSNPILLQSLGTTIIDLSTGVFVVAAWLMLAKAIRSGAWKTVAFAGALSGIAAGLKISNAIFAVAAVTMLAFLPGTLAQRLRGVVVFGIVCAGTFAAVAAPWAWRLWSEFGNPFFPFFNHWFASPDFTDAPLRYERFLASDWKAFLLRPFHMLKAERLIHAETVAPDARYAALIIALAVWGAVVLRSRIFRRSGRAVGESRHPTQVQDTSANPVTAALLCGLVTAWTLWLYSAGNSRYFLPMACVASVALAVVMQRLYAYRSDVAVTAALVILAIQLTQLVLGADLKRDGESWRGPWVDVRVPERFRNEPHLFLSAAYLSGSAFAPYLHPASGMMNITGFYALGPGHPGGARAQTLITRHIDRVRILIPLPNSYVAGGPLPSPAELLTIHVRRFGLRIDPSDCEVMTLYGNLRGAIQKRARTDSGAGTHFLTCRAVAAPDEAVAYAREVREIDQVFDRIEDTCPNLFQPRRPVTEQLPMWVRLYNMGSEIQLWIEQGNVHYFSPVMRGDPISAGTFEEWLAGARPIDCSRKSAPAFGGLLE